MHTVKRFISKGPLDDVVIFNFNTRRLGVDIWLTNEQDFGYVPKPYYPPNNIQVGLSEIWGIIMLDLAAFHGFPAFLPILFQILF